MHLNPVQEMLERIERQLGDHHSGELWRETAEAKAEQIIAEEFRRLGWSQADLDRRLKNDRDKLALTARLWRETTMSLKWVAARLQMGTWKSANSRLHAWKRANEKTLPCIHAQAIV